MREVTPLSEADCLYIAERHKCEYDFPLHIHDDYELNFIQNGRGLQRIVGDSIETIDDLELVLIAKSNLEHTWRQADCHAEDIYEITMQFIPGLFPQNLLNKNQFKPIRKLLERSQHGLAFSRDCILRVYGLIQNMLHSHDSFVQLLHFTNLLYVLAQDEASRELANSSFAKTDGHFDSRRVQKVVAYMQEHYMEDVTLEAVASLVGMTTNSFSRFFRQRTGEAFSTYLIKLRLGYAVRMLVDTTRTISEIAYQTGFNNMSNFNRLFKKYKKMSPHDFRNAYYKNKIMV